MADPSWNDVELLFHFDGADNSTTIVNEKGGAASAFGSAKISTAKSKFGGSSIVFAGSGDRVEATLSTILALAQPFCLEAQVDTTLGAYRTLFSAKTSLGSPLLWAGVNPAGITFCYVSNGVGGWSHGGEGTLAVAPSGFTSISFDSDGTNLLLFVDGALSATFAMPTGTNGDGKLIIGDYINQGQYSFVGNVDEVRMTRSSRYRAPYTPQTASFSNTLSDQGGGSYAAPTGDAVDFSQAPWSYDAPLGNAVNFPTPENEPAIPYVVGSAIGKIFVSGLMAGFHTSPKSTRIGIAYGRIKTKGRMIGSAGVSGAMSGRISPRASAVPGVRNVPRINPNTGAIEMVDTLPSCVHHNNQSLQQ